MKEWPNIYKFRAAILARRRRNYGVFKEPEKDGYAKQCTNKRCRNNRQPPACENFGEEIILRSNQEKQSKYEENELFHGCEERGSQQVRPTPLIS
jgi:hypothetical protein